MRFRAAFGPVILLASVSSAAPWAWAQESGAPHARGDRGSPVAVLREIFHKVDSNAMPCWCDKDFDKAAGPYVTPALISAVAYGSRIAHQKSIDLYDAEFFTGRPELHSVRIKEADVISDDGGMAAVRTILLVNASDPNWPQPLPITYILRKVGGVWKVDDIEWSTGGPSVKNHFLHPES